ncbi:MAG: Stk1 family PASTA domain-containing Ser/Thr kinase [Clostridiales bacterium]|nr:Stk1 family PASTA domain-containing Ser/Thr kinase [Clostridiales bacterium]
MDQYIGKMLNDRYEILDVLGVGGMAVVYKAMCHRLNRLVAVKILKPELAADPEIRSRFHDESKAVGMMSHPNIVNVYDVNQDGDIDYFVMELVEGITLKQYIKKRGGVLNWREALHFSTQIMQALGHAHSRGIVHRDIKPQNIMVLRDGSVKVADFGIAHIADSQRTMTKETLGSVHYISPEQAKGSEVDQRSDIYSAGVVLYEMLTGRLPYEGDTPVAVAVQHINSIPLAPRELNPDIPRGMEQIIMKAMAQDRELRYPNAEAMLADLEAFRKDPAIVFDYQDPWMLTELPEVTPYQPEEVEVQSEPTEEDDDEEDEDTGSGRRTAFIIGGVILAILLVIFLIFRMLWATLFSDLFGTGEVYTVPDLRGMTYTEAEEYLFTTEELNGHFTVTISEETVYDATYDVGEIVSQDPGSGTSTKSDVTEITVVLCAEPEEEAAELVMPNIVGKDYSEWASTLNEDYHVTVKYNPQYSSDYDEGLIISTDPVAGATLTEGQTVTLTYSRGEKITTVTMVSLYGMTENKAKETIAELGLSTGSVTTVTSSETAGTVVFQSVKSGAEVELGTEVNLQISSGPQPADPEPEEEEEEEEEAEQQQTDDNTSDNDTENTENTENTEDAENTENTENTEDNENTENTEDTDTQDETQEDTVYSITVTMPSGRSDASTVSIRVNGVNYYSATVPANQSTVSVEYKGTIESLEVLVDGNSYSEYTVQ